MTKKQLAQKRQDLIAHIISIGYVEDRYGNYIRATKAGVKLRIKMQATSIRMEKQVRVGDKNEWVNRLRTICYIRYFAVLPDGRMTFKKVNP